MEHTEGYSYHQKDRLDALASELEKWETEVEKKVVADNYNADISILDAKDDSHFTSINNLKQAKVTLADYNAKTAELENKDNQNNTRLNALNTGYGAKASKLIFNNKVLTMDALNENHDMRLDELDNRFSDIHPQLYETIVQELDKKIDSADFYALLNQANVGQTGLSGEVANILLQSEMDALNANQNQLIAAKANKAEFDNNTEAIGDRHMDIEKRLMAVDQFFRLFSETYKIYNKTTNEEVKYNAGLLPVDAEDFFTFTSRKTNRLGITLIRFAYNIFNNKISVLDNTNNEIGFGVKNNFNSMSLSSDIVFSTTPAFPLKVQFLNTAGDVLFERSISSATYNNLINPSAVSISYGSDIRYFQNGSNIDITPTLWSGPIGTANISPADGLTINTATGKITGVATSTNNKTYTVSVISADGIESATNTVVISIFTPPNISYTAPSGLKTGDSINISPANTGGTISSYTLVTGSLPTGLSFSTGTGVFSGNVSIAGTYNFTVRANGLSGSSSTTSIAITVIPSITEMQFRGINGNPVFAQGLTSVSIAAQAIAPNGDVYIGGQFSFINNVRCNNIARWIAAENRWTFLGTSELQNGISSAVSAIAISPTTGVVYVGGNFTLSDWNGATGGIATNRIAQWTPTSGGGTWSVLGSASANGVNSQVSAIAVSPTTDIVYVGGSFTFVNWNGTTGTAANRIAQWIPSSGGAGTWSVLGSASANGVNNVGSVSTIAVSPTTNIVYVGGFFTAVNWNGTTGTTANRAAQWVPSSGGAGTWAIVGSSGGNGFNSGVNVIAISPVTGIVYIGGAFGLANWISGTTGITANRIVGWIPESGTTGSWSVLGSSSLNGVTSTVNTIAISPTTGFVYVGGAFTSANTNSGTITTNRIAQWNPAFGGTWTALGSSSANGFNSTVSTIVVYPTTGVVYVGGSFSFADWNGAIGTATTRLAQWTPSSGTNGTWSSWASAFSSGSIWAQAIAPNGDIYIGGIFAFVNNVRCSNIARWIAAENRWTFLGDSEIQNGTNAQVSAIAISPTTGIVYVGGNFTLSNSLVVGTPTGVAANRITQWIPGVGSSGTWSALGSSSINGFDNSVNSIAVSPTTGIVYVGGTFASANWNGSSGITANRIAQWVPSSGTAGTWAAVGTSGGNGFNQTVNSVAVSPTTGIVYVGGMFTFSNWNGTTGIATNNIAQWTPSSGTAGTWAALGSNGVSHSVNSVAVSPTTGVVYVGGAFTSANSSSVTANRIAQWTPSSGTAGTWAALGSGSGNGLDSVATSIAVSPTTGVVYAGGSFTTANFAGTTVTVNNIAQWTPSSGTAGTWAVLGTSGGNGVNASVNTVAVSSTGAVYTGGTFVQANVGGATQFISGMFVSYSL